VYGRRMRIGSRNPLMLSMASIGAAWRCRVHLRQCPVPALLDALLQHIRGWSAFRHSLRFIWAHDCVDTPRHQVTMSENI